MNNNTNATQSGQRRFVIAFLCVLFVIQISLAALNYVINPLGYFNGLPLAKIMNTAPQIFSSLRFHKAYDVWRSAPDHLVLGSSRVGFGLSNFEDFFNGKTYNNGLPGAKMYEIARSLEHAHTIKPLRSAMIGLDFFAFDNHGKKIVSGFKLSRMLTTDTADVAHRKLRLNLTYDMMDGLFSVDAANASISRILTDTSTNTSRIILNDDGGWGITSAKKNHSTVDEQVSHYKRFEDMYIRDIWPVDGKKFSLHGYDSPLNIYKDTIRFAHKHGIKIKMFINPVHSRLLVILDELGLWQCYEQWKRELWRINVEVANELKAQPFELWDFAGVDNWTTENINQNETLDWFVDSAHFNQRLGKIILGQMLLNEKHGFGTYITDIEAMEGRLEMVRNGLDIYRQDKKMLDGIKAHISEIRKGLPKPNIGTCTSP